MKIRRWILIGLFLSGVLLSGCNVGIFAHATIEPTPLPPTENPTINRVEQIPMPNPVDPELLEEIPDLISQALFDLRFERYAEVIESWDQVLSILSDYAYGYAFRAEIYGLMAENEDDPQQKEEYTARALEDSLTALEIGPVIGDYYEQTFRFANQFANLSEPEYLERLPLLNEAIDYIPEALDLITIDQQLNYTLGAALAEANRCREAFDYLDRIAALQGTFSSTKAGLEYALAVTHLCLQDYDDAIEEMDTAMRQVPTQERYLYMAQIYYQTGEYSYAIDTLNNSFSTYGDHSGWRYYLRAAAYYELGYVDQAEDDLDRGMEQTWVEDHLRAYVLGRIALDEGNDELGLELLEIAQRTLSPAEFPMIFEKIDEIFTTYSYESDYQLPPTMLFADYPAYTDAEMTLPDPPDEVESPLYVNYQGTGYIIPYGEAYEEYFHTLVFTHRRSDYIAEILEVDLILQGYFIETGLQQGELGVTFQIYNFEREMWENLPELAFGRISIFDPSVYFSEEGFMYLNIEPVLGRPRVIFSNIALEILGTDEDGELIFLGYGQEP